MFTNENSKVKIQMFQIPIELSHHFMYENHMISHVKIHIFQIHM